MMWTYKQMIRETRLQSRRLRTGFTLIELLVVIAIITLLVSIIMPSIGRAKRMAKTVVCAANAKGIGTAMFMYADEWNEKYPCASNVGNWGYLVANVNIDIYSWMEQLFPYVETKKMYLCPEKPTGSEYSYFLGSRAAFLHTDGDFASVERSRVKYSAALVLSGCTSHEFSLDPDDCDKDDYTQNCVGETVHDGNKQNILFEDGHVNAYEGYVEGEMTFAYRQMREWKMDGDPE